MTLLVNSVIKKYGGHTAVDNVSFSIGRGFIFGLLGPNGAGKTTLIRMICSLVRPCVGEIVVDGHRLWSDGHNRARNSIGYGAQKFSLYENLTILENLEFFGRLRGLNNTMLQERCRQLIDDLGLERRLNQRACELSGGWKQRLTLAVAVMNKPSLLILDEPTAGMDSISRRAIWDYIHTLSNDGVACLITTHYMDEAERCSHIGFMVNGRIVAMDTPSKLKSSTLVTPEDKYRLRILLESIKVDPLVWESIPGVREAIPFGDVWHVLADKSLSEQTIVNNLEKRGLRCLQCTGIQASLEDSFVVFTKRHLHDNHYY